jgi:hypothetical protein
MRVARRLAIVASILLLGCSTPTHTNVASAVSGAWTMRESIPGNEFSMTLVANGSSLSGGGTFAGEAGLRGDLTVEGAVAGSVVNLDFTLHTEFPVGAQTSTEHFTGHLVLGQLSGTMQVGDPLETSPAPTVFVRPVLILK